MDVRCRQCGTEYELDDARVAASGTTVKCSTCSHVFKVLPTGDTRDSSGSVRSAPGSAPSSPAPASRQSGDTPVLGSPSSQPPQPAGDWMVRKVDGAVFRFRELTTLQKWIVERKVVRDDEISRTGKSWKRLGEIAELTSFFQVVEAAEAAQRAVTASMMPQVHLTATPTGTFQSFPLQQALEQQGAAPQTVPAPPSDPAALALMAAPMAGAPTPEPPPARPITLAAPARGPQPPPTLSVELDEDDPVLAWQRRRGRLTMAAGVTVAAVALAVVVVVVAGQGANADAPLRTAAQRALRLGDPPSVAAARALFQSTRSHAVPGLDARIAAEDGRRQRDAAALLDEAAAVARDPSAPAPTSASAPAQQAQLRLAEAAALVPAARAVREHNVDADLAAATVALARGDLEGLAQETTRARQNAGELSEAERGVVDDELRLLLTLAEAARVAPKDESAAQAAHDKLARFDDVRAKAAAAMLALPAVRAARDTALASTAADRAVDGTLAERARAQLASLPDADPRKEAGLTLLTALTTLPPPAPPEVVPAPDAPPPDAPPPDAPKPDPPKPDVPKPDVPAAEESFEQLMARGEKALAAERSAAAYEAFKKATIKDATSAKAWLKLGWASLDSGKKGDAARAFERALSLSPGLHEARFGLAEALRFAGRTDEAIANYKRYLEDDPKGRDANIARNALKQLE